jgi:hypothetical protein
MKPDATENIEESNPHGTDLSIAVNEGTREPSDEVQRVANGGYEVPLSLEEINEPVYNELNEPSVLFSRNPSDATRSFGPCEEPIYFELDDPRCLNEPAANDTDKNQESTYVEMSPILYTNVTSSFDNLEESVDNSIGRQMGRQLEHAVLAQSDENPSLRQPSRLLILRQCRRLSI